MSTNHQSSNGSYELYDNKNSAKGLRSGIPGHDDSALPPGGPAFYPPMNTQQTKEIERLTMELFKSKNTVEELQQKLKYTTISDPVYKNEHGTADKPDLEDFKDSHICHLQRQVTILQADLFKKERTESRMIEMTQEKNALVDKLHLATTELTAARRDAASLKEQSMSQIHDLQLKVKQQKEIIDQLKNERDRWSISRKGDNQDTTSPPQSTTIRSQSSAGSPSLRSAMTAAPEGSCSQELEHLHKMVDVLRKTVMDQRNLFLKMGLQGRVASNNITHSVLPNGDSLTKLPTPNGCIVKTTLSQTPSHPINQVSQSPSPSPSQPLHRQAEENSEKLTPCSTTRMVQSLEGENKVGINLEESVMLASGSDMRLSDKGSVQQRHKQPQIQKARSSEHYLDKRPTWMEAVIDPALVQGYTADVQAVKNVLSSNSSHSSNCSERIKGESEISSSDDLPQYTMVKDLSEGCLNITSVVDSVSSSTNQHDKVPINGVSQYPSGCGINQDTSDYSIEGNPALRVEATGINPTNDLNHISNLRDVDLVVGTSVDGHKDEAIYMNASNSMLDPLVKTRGSNERLSGELNSGRPITAACSSTSVTLPQTVHRNISQTEIIKCQPPLIEATDLPHKSKTEIVGQNLRMFGQQNMRFLSDQNKGNVIDLSGENFMVQYPPDMQGLSHNPSKALAFMSNNRRALSGPQQHFSPHMLQRSSSGSSGGASHHTLLSNNNNIQQLMNNSMVKPQQVISPPDGVVNHIQHRMAAPLSPSFSNSNTLSNISDVTSSCLSYPIPTTTSVETYAGKAKVNINSSDNLYVPILPPSSSSSSQQKQQQQQYVNDYNFNANVENNADENDRLCPVCHNNFTNISMEDFQAHVFDCFDNENGPETLLAEQLGNNSSSDFPLQQGTARGRSCPMCQQKFAVTISQEEFEQHVHRHFGEETFELIGQ